VGTRATVKNRCVDSKAQAAGSQSDSWPARAGLPPIPHESARFTNVQAVAACRFCIRRARTDRHHT